MASALSVRLPDWDRRRLEDRAVARARELAIERGYCDWWTADVDRLVVNMLRHEFTGYDESRSQRAHAIVCEAIAGKYSWLAAECERQTRRRRDSERLEAAAVSAYEEHEEAQRVWRRERVAESREAIRQLVVGTRILARVKGHERVARIVKVGRSRVTISYRIKSGEERTALVYARDVEAEMSSRG
jgi:hypothetical protein